MKRMITVSNKAVNNGDNIWKILNTPTQDGYIFNIPAHSADRELKQYILKDDDYEWVGEGATNRKISAHTHASSISRRKMGGS